MTVVQSQGRWCVVPQPSAALRLPSFLPFIMGREAQFLCLWLSAPWLFIVSSIFPCCSCLFLRNLFDYSFIFFPTVICVLEYSVLFIETGFLCSLGCPASASSVLDIHCHTCATPYTASCLNSFRMWVS